ncbi:MAG: hypothetical protein PHV11_03845 [Candidatus Bipolaricaulis sp.]|nr:hypothetical protein [Candidatus Bipolaricaulis sp.]
MDEQISQVRAYDTKQMLQKRRSELVTERDIEQQTGGREQAEIAPKTEANLPPPVTPVEAVSEVATKPETPLVPPPVKPPAPPTTTPAGRPIPSNPDEVTKKLSQAIREAKPAREITEQLKHQELSKRAAIFASILQSGEGYEAFQKAKGALKGPLPEADFTLDLESIGITDADIQSMYDKIRLADMRPFQKLNTEEALTKLLCGQIPTEGELVRLESMFGSELIKAIQSKYTTGQKIMRGLEDILNIPRTLQTIADLSATLRQGAVLAFGQPIETSKAFVSELKAAFSSKNYKVIDEIVHNNVYAEKAEEHKLYIAPIGEAAGITAREEAYMGRLIEKVPVLGEIIKASERAYVTFLNVQRMETWAHYCKEWEGTGKSWADYDKLADFINHATGRGDLGKLENASTWLNAAFYSPRYIASRLQVPLDLINTTPAVRKIVARNLIAFTVGGLSILGAIKLAGGEVEDDPRSSDFGKGKIGNMRFDFWGGFQPYARLAAQLMTGERKSTATGAIIPVDRQDIVANFLRSKLAPIPGLVWDLGQGETFIGEELTAENAGTIIYEKLTPMVVQDIIDAYKDLGVEGALMAIPSILGIGVQTYADNWNTEEDKLGLPVRSDAMPYTIENEIYDTADYYSKVGAMIGTATADMLSEKKNVPDKVMAVAEARDIKKITNDILNAKLTDINTDESKGDTFEQFYAQWQAREKITDEAELKEFDKAYPDAYKGNLSQRQYVLIQEYSKLESDAERREFVKEHPEVAINPREEYLRSHPEENAKLAIFGQADVLTQKAYDMAQKMIVDLDIPDSAVKDFLPPAEVAKPYFEYQESASKWGSSSPEVKKLLVENPELAEFLDRDIPDTPMPVLDLQIKNRELNAEYESLDAEARKAFLSQNPEYARDLKVIDAYNVGFTDQKLITAYADYYTQDLKDYEDDWFLMENKDFYQSMIDKGIWQPKDFSKVPSRQVYGMYQTYQSLAEGTPRMQYRLDNPLLDDWLVRVKGYTKATLPKPKTTTVPKPTTTVVPKKTTKTTTNTTWSELMRRIEEAQARLASIGG